MNKSIEEKLKELSNHIETTPKLQRIYYVGEILEDTSKRKWRVVSKDKDFIIIRQLDRRVEANFRIQDIPLFFKREHNREILFNNWFEWLIKTDSELYYYTIDGSVLAAYENGEHIKDIPIDISRSLLKDQPEQLINFLYKRYQICESREDIIERHQKKS